MEPHEQRYCSGTGNSAHAGFCNLVQFKYKYVDINIKMVEMAFYGKQMKGNSVSEETWAPCFIANFISCSQSWTQDQMNKPLRLKQNHFSLEEYIRAADCEAPPQVRGGRPDGNLTKAPAIYTKKPNDSQRWSHISELS